MVSADASQGSAVGCSGSNESLGMCASSRGARPRACTQAKAAAAAAAASTAGSALEGTQRPSAHTLVVSLWKHWRPSRAVCCFHAVVLWEGGVCGMQRVRRSNRATAPMLIHACALTSKIQHSPKKKAHRSQPAQPACLGLSHLATSAPAASSASSAPQSTHRSPHHTCCCFRPMLQLAAAHCLRRHWCCLLAGQK